MTFYDILQNICSDFYIDIDYEECSYVERETGHYKEGEISDHNNEVYWSHVNFKDMEDTYDKLLYKNKLPYIRFNSSATFDFANNITHYLDEDIINRYNKNLESTSYDLWQILGAECDLITLSNDYRKHADDSIKDNTLIIRLYNINPELVYLFHVLCNNKYIHNYKKVSSIFINDCNYDYKEFMKHYENIIDKYIELYNDGVDIFDDKEKMKNIKNLFKNLGGK